MDASSGSRRRPDQVGAGFAPSNRVGESTTCAVTRRRRQGKEKSPNNGEGHRVYLPLYPRAWP